MEEARSIREVFMEELIQQTKQNKQIMVVDPDVGSATKTWDFNKIYPEQFIELGIAEQNAFGVAAGLAACGKIVFAATFAVFASMRACEMIRTSICYPKHNVKIIGGYAGLSNGKDGATHQSVEDLAIMRSFPNLIVCSISDNVIAKKIITALIEYTGPVYVRMEYETVSDVHKDDSSELQLGKGYAVRSGNDVTIVTTGTALHRAIKAVDELGISADVIDMVTIKPLDTKILEKSLQKTGRLITLEDHSLIGGLSSAISEYLIKSDIKVRYEGLGIHDVFTESGKTEELLDKYHIGKNDVIEAIKRILM
ncbi:MAG: transketolase family protein [Bacteroidetes bacterium]|nr:transketolase family protein [Bacteroidota bacterium]